MLSGLAPDEFGLARAKLLRDMLRILTCYEKRLAKNGVGSCRKGGVLNGESAFARKLRRDSLRSF
jgi:hypothetical protein